MSLLLVYLALLIVSQSASLAAALMVERMVSPGASILVFIGLYFSMFWLTWVIAVWLTVPGKRLGAYLTKTPPAAVQGR